MMILEEGTDEQMLECAFQACLPLPCSRWVYYRYDEPYCYFIVRDVRGSVVLTDTCMIDFSVDQWVLLVAEGKLRDLDFLLLTCSQTP